MKAFFLAVPLMAMSLAARSDAFDDMLTVCSALERTGMTTECKFKAPRMIDVTIDTTGAEARKICAGVAAQSAETFESFKVDASNGKAWKLRVISPYSNNTPIAICTIR